MHSLTSAVNLQCPSAPIAPTKTRATRRLRGLFKALPDYCGVFSGFELSFDMSRCEYSLLSRYPSPFLSAVENTIFASVAASSRDRRPSRLASSVSNCALEAVPVGAVVLSLSPPNATSGSTAMTAVAMNDLEIFMNSPEHLREGRWAGRPKFIQRLAIVFSLSLSLRHRSRRVREGCAAESRHRPTGRRRSETTGNH